ncbi:MAG: hypothetical protein KDC84_00460 [Crocinitomicaceae bacterium]|nr:hypothetical protein [Crocinitomicaceae bacterium]
MRYIGFLVFLILFSCKEDPTIVELSVYDANLDPADSAMVIFTGDPYDTSYSNEIIFNDTFYTEADGTLEVNFSDRQINGQTGFVTALVKVYYQSLYKEFNLRIFQFQTTTKKVILQ